MGLVMWWSHMGWSCGGHIWAGHVVVTYGAGHVVVTYGTGHVVVTYGAGHMLVCKSNLPCHLCLLHPYIDVWGMCSMCFVHARDIT